MSDQSIVSNLMSQLTAYFMPAAVNPPSEEDVKVVFDILMDNVNKNSQLNTQLCHFFNLIEILRKLQVFLREKARTYSLVEVFSIPALMLNFDGVLASIIDKTLLSVSEDQRCRNLSDQMHRAVLLKTVCFFQGQNEDVLKELDRRFKKATYEQVENLERDLFASLEPFLAYTHTAGGIATAHASELDMLASLFWQEFKANENSLELMKRLTLRALHETQLQAISDNKHDAFKQHMFEARKLHGESNGFVGYNFFDTLHVNIERLRETSFIDILRALGADEQVSLVHLIQKIGAGEEDFVFKLGQAAIGVPKLMDKEEEMLLRAKYLRFKSGRVMYGNFGLAIC